MLAGAERGRPVLETRRLSKQYGGRRGVRAVDLRLDAGEIMALLGPNGAGKSTLIRCALGFVHPSAGSVRLFGTSPMAGDRSVMRKIGYVPERYSLYPELSGWEHLELFGRLSGLPRSRRGLRVEEVARSLGLEKRLEEAVRRYSHGMRQRLVIAQALLHEPTFLILDEPTNGLDPDGVARVRTLIRQAAQTGTTVLLSSHRLEEVESVAGRVAVLLQGKILQDGRMDELMADRDAPVLLEVTLERPVPQAARVLDDLPGVLDAHVEGEGLQLVVTVESRGRVAQVTRTLVDAGARVVGVNERSLGLEEVYRRLTREGGA